MPPTESTTQGKRCKGTLGSRLIEHKVGKYVLCTLRILRGVGNVVYSMRVVPRIMKQSVPEQLCSGTFFVQTKLRIRREDRNDGFYNRCK